MDDWLNDSSITECFETFEAREKAFNAAVGHLVPVRYQGPSVFWRDFQQIMQSGGGGGQGDQNTTLPAYITSNPMDCLAFGTPAQVLAAARAIAVKHHGDLPIQVDDVVRQFNLQAVSDHPIRTLSGGETVRLALAKAMFMAESNDQLIVSSPFCWMSAAHSSLLTRVLAHYRQCEKQVRILAMTGEMSQATAADALVQAMASSGPGPSFELVCKDVRIDLGTVMNAVTSPSCPALVQDVHWHLRSPCLLVGDNGQGKSLLAKALSGAVVIKGTAAITASGSIGRACLLFQDVVTQTLMRTVNVLTGKAYDSIHGSVNGIRRGIIERFARWTGREEAAISRTLTENSLLAVKMTLIAVRLAHQPAALILDEPDWGLSRSDALSLVPAVIEEAHSRQIPVIIISHKPWWRPLAADIIEAARETPMGDSDGFTIRLHRLEPSI